MRPMIYMCFAYLVLCFLLHSLFLYVTCGWLLFFNVFSARRCNLRTQLFDMCVLVCRNTNSRPSLLTCFVYLLNRNTHCDMRSLVIAAQTPDPAM